jgi:hypothetical protein
MEGVEPSWPLDRRLLRPVRIPVPPHPRGRAAGPHAQSGRLARSCSRPRTRPLGPCSLEAGLATRLELDDLGRTRHLLGPWRDPYEVEMHLRLLSVSKGARGALVLRERRGRSRRSAAASRCRSRRRRASPDRTGRRSRSRSRPCRPRPAAPRCPRRGGSRGAPGPGGCPPRGRVDGVEWPLRPATILLLEQACQGSNPDQRGWSSPCFRLHHRPKRERTTRVERASPGAAPRCSSV